MNSEKPEGLSASSPKLRPGVTWGNGPRRAPTPKRVAEGHDRWRLGGFWRWRAGCGLTQHATFLWPWSLRSESLGFRTGFAMTRAASALRFAAAVQMGLPRGAPFLRLRQKVRMRASFRTPQAVDYFFHPTKILLVSACGVKARPRPGPLPQEREKHPLSRGRADDKSASLGD